MPPGEVPALVMALIWSTMLFRAKGGQRQASRQSEYRTLPMCAPGRNLRNSTLGVAGHQRRAQWRPREASR